MSELPILDELRGELLAAMREASAPRRVRPLLLAGVLLALLAATAAAATFSFAVTLLGLSPAARSKRVRASAYSPR